MTNEPAQLLVLKTTMIKLWSFTLNLNCWYVISNIWRECQSSNRLPYLESGLKEEGSVMSYQCSPGLPNPNRVHLSCALCEFVTFHFLQDKSRLGFLACPDTSGRRETHTAWHTGLVSAAAVEQLMGKKDFINIPVSQGGCGGRRRPQSDKGRLSTQLEGGGTGSEVWEEFRLLSRNCDKKSVAVPLWDAVCEDVDADLICIDLFQYTHLKTFKK